MDRPKTIEFEGITYRLMGGRRRYYLSQSTTNAGRRGAKGLHVAIWESHHGRPVPPGHEIHHDDGDTFNNAPANLVCLPRAEHRKTVKFKDPAAQAAILARARLRAAEWHGSPEGLRWHSENGRKSWEGRQKVALQCEECRGSFESFRPDARFCKPSCGARNRYRRARD